MTSILLFFGEKTVDSNPYLDAKYTLRPEAFGAVLFFYGTDGDYLSYLSHTEALIVACSDGLNSIENICSIISHIFACDTVDAKKKIEDVFHRLNSGNHEIIKTCLPRNTHGKDKLLHSMLDAWNKEQISSKISQKLRSPISVTIAPSTKCTTDCIYCYADRDAFLNSSIIPTETWNKAISELANSGTKYLILSGSDPLLYLGIHKLIETAIAGGMSVSLSTKTPISEARAVQLANAGMNINTSDQIHEIQISLDSVTSRLSQIVGNGMNIDAIRKTIHLLVDNKITVNIQTVLTNLNSSQDELDKLYRFLRPLGISSWKIRTAFKSNNNLKTTELVPPDESILSCESFLSSLNSQGDFKIDLSGIHKKGGSAINRREFCPGGISSIFIRPDGFVSLCETCQFQIGTASLSIRDTSILDIWHSKELEELRHPDPTALGRQCKDCTRASVCIDEGFCIAENIHIFNGTFVPDNHCTDSAVWRK
ncbi:MAG: radical SAM protein [Spirochaetia bacterium]|nr:radical SAM protein [Spirochaetia bacterium]